MASLKAILQGLVRDEYKKINIVTDSPTSHHSTATFFGLRKSSARSFSYMD